jgi:hypothetical protein
MSLNPREIPSFVSRQQVSDTAVLTFDVEPNFHPPENIMTCSISQFQNVLTFASKLIGMEESLANEYTRDSLFAEYLKDIKEKHSGELSEREKQVSARYISEIHEAHSDYEKQLKELKKSKAAIESEMTCSKVESEAAHKKEMRAITKRLAELEAEIQVANKSESLIRERCQEEFARHLKVVEDAHKEIIRVKEECLSQREQKLIIKEQELQSKIQRTASSVLKGQDGEHYFKAIAKEKMNWDLIKMPTFSCDYSATINNTPVLFEIKNYGHAVKSDEVKKFLRDMKLHPEVPVGVFISLVTNIQGRDPNVPIGIEWINDSQCAMYFQSCAEIDVDYTLSIINQVIRITQAFNSIIESRELDSSEPIFKTRIDQAKVYLDRMVTRGNKLMKKIVSDKKQQIDLIEMNTTHNLSELKYQHTDLITTIQTLLGDYVEVENEVELATPEVTVTPGGVVVKKQAKRRKSVAAAAANANVNTGAKIEKSV